MIWLGLTYPFLSFRMKLKLFQTITKIGQYEFLHVLKFVIEIFYVNSISHFTVNTVSSYRIDI